MNFFFKTSKANFLILPFYDTNGNYTVQKSNETVKELSKIILKYVYKSASTFP